MKVLSNISLTLKELNRKIKGEEKLQSSKPWPLNPTKPTGISKEQRIAEPKPLVESGTLNQHELDDLIEYEF